MGLKIIGIALFLPAVISFWYGYMIFKAHSGSSFFLVWVFFGALFGLLGVGVLTGLLGRLPKWIGITSAVAAGLAVILVTVILVRVISFSENDPEPGLDYIIVLGAQIRENGPSRVLRYRLETAAEYLSKNRETRCIVSGGKGSNEIVSEASAMRDYLVGKGIDAERILLEDRSVNTDENIVFSKKFIPDGSSVGVLTNDFHLCRACYLCKKHGIEKVHPISAGSDPFYRPNNYLREAFAFIKEYLNF